MKIVAGVIIVVLWIASVVGALWAGTKYQSALDQANAAKIEQAIEDTRKAANEGAADAISKIVVRNTTIQGRVETIVRDNPVYRDCQHDADQLRNLNEVLTGRRSTGSGVVP